MKKSMIGMLVVLFLGMYGCYSHVPLTKEINYKAVLVENSPFIIFLEGTNSINPEYVKVIVANLSDKEYSGVYVLNYNITQARDFSVSAKNKLELKIYVGCSGSSCLQGQLTFMLFDKVNESDTYIKKVQW